MESRLSHKDYTVGWICALPLEMAAAKTMLDLTHPDLPQAKSDNNSYVLGEVARHNVVIACLPAGVYGTTSATSVAKDMLSTYTEIKIGLMVGIGGGAPSETNDIRLGDIVVSQPSGRSGGVIQYDHGKATVDGRFEHTGAMNKPPSVLLTASSHLQCEERLFRSQLQRIIQETRHKHSSAMSSFEYPGSQQDVLFPAEYPHPPSMTSCDECDRDKKIPRDEREDPKVFYGLIASANQVMKDGIARDRLARQHGILCFEMEAAGLMDIFPCLVIRGICDYADSHKNKQWQGYAALTAAAYAKWALSMTAILSPKPIRDKKENFQFTPQDEECLRSLFLTDPEEDRLALKRRKGVRAQGTCKWILQTDEITEWLKDGKDSNSNVLWLYGNPGTGKTTMTVALTEEIVKRHEFCEGVKLMAYFFCDSADDNRRTVTAILRGLLYQFQKQCPHLLAHFRSKFSERGKAIFNSFDALWSILMNIINDESTDHLYCVIDALDECEDNSQHDLLEQLNQYYRSSERSEEKLHILITSRPYPEIFEHLGLFRHKDLSEYHQRQRDIRQLISEKVRELKGKKRYPTSVEEDVTRVLLEKAEGTFLWIGIACQELSKVTSSHAVKLLQRLPRGLDSLYRELLHDAIQQNQGEEEKITEILHLVAVAQTTMTVSTLSQACQCYEDQSDENRIAFFRDDIAMCRLMVIVQDDFVRLLHKSVKDFVLETESGNVTKIRRAHATLSYRCISYLIKWPLEDKAVDKRFFRYSGRFWGQHAHLANKEFSIRDEHLSFYVYSSMQWNGWYPAFRLNIHLPSRPSTTKYTIFHAAATWDIEPLARHGLQMLKDNSMGSHSIMFDDREFSDPETISPLQIAAKHGSTSVMEILLAGGDKTIGINTEVLHAALKNIADGARILQLLLSHSGCRIEVTKIILELAAQNLGCGADIFNVITNHFGDGVQIHVTESVLRHAAANPQMGEKLTELIGEIFHRNLGDLATLGVFEAAVLNSKQMMKVVGTLLNYMPGIMVSEDIVEMAIRKRRNTRDLTLFLFSHADRARALTQNLMLTAASYSTQLCQDLIKMTLEDAKDLRLAIEVQCLIIRWCDEILINMFLDAMAHHTIITQDMIDMARDKHVKRILKSRLDAQRNFTMSTESGSPEDKDPTAPPPQFYHIRQTGVLKDYTDEVWCSAFALDGSKFASGGKDGVVRVYNAVELTCLAVLTGHDAEIMCLGWSPDNKKLVGGSRDNKILLWDAETYQCLSVAQRHKQPITSISWVPSGESFICSSLDLTFSHWTSTGKLLHITDMLFRSQHSCITPDGSQLIIVDTERKLHIYDLKKYAKLKSIPLEGKATSVMVELGTNLALLDVYTPETSELQLIDPTDGTIVQRFRSAQLRGEFVTRCAFFAKSNSLILGGSEDGKICVWNRSSGSLLDVLDQHSHGCVNSISINPTNPEMFISTGDDCTVRVWEMYCGVS